MKIHLLAQKIFHLQDYELENEAKVTQILSALKLVTMIYLCKFKENLSPGSKIFHLQDYDLANEVKVTEI